MQTVDNQLKRCGKEKTILAARLETFYQIAAAFSSFPKNILKAKCKRNGLISLPGENPRQPNIEYVTQLLVIGLTQINKKMTQRGSKKYTLCNL